MSFKYVTTFTLLIACILAPLTASAVECPYKLLWTNGVLWCYSTVTCVSPIACNSPTNVVLIYNHVLPDSGCNLSPTNCECKIPDNQNDYLFRVIVESQGESNVYEMNPDLPIQINDCSFMDSFNVPIPESDIYYQCMEFRFSPGPTMPPRNIRIAIKLKSKPSTHLVNESITLTPTHLVRKVNGQEIKYQLLIKGMLMPEEQPAPTPEGNAGGTGQNEQQQAPPKPGGESGGTGQVEQQPAPPKAGGEAGGTGQDENKPPAPENDGGSGK